MNDYPANWPQIAQRIKDDADWQCEACGHPHDPPSGYTLTVHHLDMDKANCSDENLVALCQRCHLSIQARRITVNQLELPGLELAWMQKRRIEKTPTLAYNM